MLKRLLNFKWLVLILSLLILSSACFADDDTQLEAIYSDKTKLASQQIVMLKDRIHQAQFQLQTLQKQENLFSGLVIVRANNRMLKQVNLDIAIAKSNLDSINIELTECQQTIIRLEKDIQEMQNQLNAYTIFGLKIARNATIDLKRLREELNYQTGLLTLEKNRGKALLQLQSIADSILQANKIKFGRIDSNLKSQTILQLKEQQAQSEVDLQTQQNGWLLKLNQLDAQWVNLQNAKHQDKALYEKLQNEIFYVNENVNLTYLRMLIARYQEQIQQLKISISRNSSITLLNKASEETLALGKQILRVNRLLKIRQDILDKRKALFSQATTTSFPSAEFNTLEQEYTTALNNVTQLNQELTAFRTSLDQALQQELSARQGLPGFGTKAWVDLGTEILLVPSLAFQVFKNLTVTIFSSITNMTLLNWILLAVLQISWVALVLIINYFLKVIVARLPDHQYGHINLKWLIIKLLHRNLYDLAFIGNVVWLLSFFAVPSQNITIFVNLALVWVIFKAIMMTARLCLVETVHDRIGQDIRLYHHLKWIFLSGGIITALTVFMHQLPIVYEVKDLFDRLFLAFLLIASLFFLRQWELVPNLILPHIDTRRTYLRRVVTLLGLLIPIILLVNSVIGLLGYVNLILTISWYESIFLFVLVIYLLLRGLLNDAMELVYRVLIRHVTNGWLWTEAVLKPIDRMLKIILFLFAWAVLFLLYGWDQQSPVVERLNKLLSYHLIDVLNTTITPLSIIELVVIISLLYWAVRWTREFVYRLLLSRTKDLGLRNSIAILSQYAMIVFGIFICLRLLGIDIKSLTFVITAFAFGVGLGLRDLVNNFACGFLLLIERPLRVGDTVSISGYEGDVTHIGGRAVTIRTWDHMDVLIPNAEIFSKSFTNWTAKDSIVRTVINLKISRHDKPQDVQQVIHQVLAQHKDVLSDPIPEVFMKEMTDGVIEFEVRYYINLRIVKSRVGLRSDVLVAIWDAFEKHHILPPYPQHEIFLKGGFPLDHKKED